MVEKRAKHESKAKASAAAAGDGEGKAAAAMSSSQCADADVSADGGCEPACRASRTPSASAQEGTRGGGAPKWLDSAAQSKAAKGAAILQEEPGFLPAASGGGGKYS